MSVWGDIRKRGLGIETKEEDVFPCVLNPALDGQGTKLPKRFIVPGNIRVQRINFVLTKTEITIPFKASNIIDFRPFAWTYKVGEKSIDGFFEMVNDIIDEYGDFTYIIKKKKAELTDTATKMLEELKKRIKEYNESVCGVPLWTVDPLELP